ncbi:MAG: acetolactate synthase large subunit [Planctomycetaceae bacterium]
MKASDLFLRCLEAEGVEYIFGVPGEENADIMMSLLDSSIEFIVCRHEQGAAFIADVYGRLTGKPGVCLGTLGPGASNLLTGVADADMDRAPLVVITGQGSTARLHKESHQAMDVVSMFEPVVRWGRTITNADTIPEVIRKAFKIAQTEKKGAVHIELPEDIAKHRSLVPPLQPSPSERGAPNANELARAAELICAAESPIVIAGNGILRGKATAEFLQFVEQGGFPVVNTFMGKGVLPASHPQCLFTVGLQARDFVARAIEEADLVIAVGYDLVEYSPTLWNRGKDKQVINIDFVPAEVDAAFHPSVDLPADIASSLSQLADALPDERLVDPASYLEYRAVMLSEFSQHANDTGFPVKPQKILWEVRQAMHDDDILLSDVGAHKMWIARYYQCETPNTCMISNGFCSMGFALPGAIGAKISFPERRVLAICGDGGFMMNVQELETAVRLKLPLVVMIWTDSQYGLIRWKQESQFGKHSHIDFSNPDFMKLADAFGAIGLRVQAASDLPAVLEEALAADRPVVIECPVDYRENMALSRRLGEIPTAMRAQWLKKTSVFSVCSTENLEVIADYMDERHFDDGQIVCEEGQPGQEVFIITRGSADVIRDGQKVAEIGEGECFGELAVLADQPRTATVSATPEKLETLVLPGEVFREILLKQPGIGLELLESMSLRLGDDQ